MGIQCPKCGHRSTMVLETRTYMDGDSYRRIRMRLCRSCKHRYPTEETATPGLRFPYKDRRKSAIT